MITCDKCKGDGLIGNGPRPWAREGHITTCPDCKGTGKVEEPIDQSTAASEIPQTVDSVSARKTFGGIMSIFRRK